MNQHGTVTGYITHKCRCDDCRKAYAGWGRAARRRRAATPLPEEQHGKNTTYINYMCRCTPCTQAHAQYQREWKAANR